MHQLVKESFMSSLDLIEELIMDNPLNNQHYCVNRKNHIHNPLDNSYECIDRKNHNLLMLDYISDSVLMFGK